MKEQQCGHWEKRVESKSKAGEGGGVGQGIEQQMAKLFGNREKYVVSLRN